MQYFLRDYNFVVRSQISTPFEQQIASKMSYGGGGYGGGRGGGSNGYDYGRDSYKSNNYSSGYSNGYDNLRSRYCGEVWRNPLLARSDEAVAQV